MALSNKHRFSKEFKEEEQRGVLSIDLCKRDSLWEYKNIFTMKKLLKYRKIFSEYLKLNGNKAPAHTRYSWFNEPINYTLSFTHYIATNQEYANEVLNLIDLAKLNAIGCDLLLTSFAPVKGKLFGFPTEQNAAYVRVNGPGLDKLFYINKAKDIYHEFKVDQEKIEMFDLHMQPTSKIKMLSDVEIKKVPPILGHIHKRQEYIAVFQALVKIKEVHSNMKYKRISGRVWNGLEETLKAFDLPNDDQAFNEKTKKILEIFELAKELNENERIYTPAFIP